MFTFENARVPGDGDRWGFGSSTPVESPSQSWEHAVSLTGAKNGSRKSTWSDTGDMDPVDRLTKVIGDASDPEMNGMIWSDRAVVNPETRVNIHDGTIHNTVADWQVITSLTRVYLGEVHIGCIVKTEDRAYAGDVRWFGFRLCPDGTYRRWTLGDTRQEVARRMTYHGAPLWSDNHPSESPYDLNRNNLLDMTDVWDMCKGGTVEQGDKQRQQSLATAVVCEGVVVFGVNVKEENE